MKFREFNNWCTSAQVKNVELKKLAGKDIPKPRNAEQLNDFFNGVNDCIGANSILDLNINVVLNQGDYIIGNKTLTSEPNINTLIFQPMSGSSGKILFKNLKITKAILTLSLDPNAELVEFRNCEIAEVFISDNVKVKFLNTKVGTLHISQCNYFFFEKGCILNFSCPVPGTSNPFSGSVTFKSCFIPRNSKKYILEGPQPYRNIRHHLKNIENGQMANFFHSAELAVERADDTLVNKVFNYAYEIFSDFGSSAGRAIFWWFLLGVLTASLIYSVDGAVNAFEDSSYYTGWRSGFLESSCNTWNDLYRSVYLSFQSMLNPLGIFGVKSLVIPAYGWLVLVLMIQGLLSAVLIALMIFAIRRRFKMSS